MSDCERTAARLAGAGWAGRPGSTLGDALLRVTRVERQIAATKVAIVGAFDASQQYRLDHQPSVGTWLAARAKADPKRVNHQRFVARRLRSMPLTERAFERGVIGFEHAAVLARANAPRVSASSRTRTPIAPSQALSLGLAAMWRRVIFGPGSHILDFGQERDYFTGPLREAIIIRDRWWKDPGCRVPGRHCHIDHVVPRSRGGPTSEANGRCQCSTGNRLKGAMPPDEWMRDGPDPEPADAGDDDP